MTQPTGSLLLIEDDEAFRRMLLDALESLGHSVAWADSAEQGLAAHHWPGNVRELSNVVERAAIFSRSGVITAADVELALGGGSGVQGVAEGLPVVLCTGNSGGAVLEAARRLGVAEVLDKPVSRLRMAEALGRVLGQKNGGRQLP